MSPALDISTTSHTGRRTAQALTAVHFWGELILLPPRVATVRGLHARKPRPQRHGDRSWSCLPARKQGGPSMRAHARASVARGENREKVT